MPRVTLYVKDADLPIWDRAKQFAKNWEGESLSSLVTDALRAALERQQVLTDSAESLSVAPDCSTETLSGWRVQMHHSAWMVHAQAEKLRRCADGLDTARGYLDRLREDLDAAWQRVYRRTTTVDHAQGGHDAPVDVASDE